VWHVNAIPRQDCICHGMANDKIAHRPDAIICVLPYHCEEKCGHNVNAIWPASIALTAY